jgi:hypothetical protein
VGRVGEWSREGWIYVGLLVAVYVVIWIAKHLLHTIVQLYSLVTPFLTLLISSVSHILSIYIPRVCVLFLFFFALVVRNTLKNKGYGM